MAGTDRALDPLAAGKAGPPSKLTADVHAFIVSAVRETVDVTVAAQARGISARTLGRWRQRSRAFLRSPEQYPQYEMYAAFWRDVRAAEAFSEVALVNTIRKSATENTADAKWLLERRHKRRWQPSAALEHSGPGGDGPVEFVLTIPQPRALEADHFGEDGSAPKQLGDGEDK